jgi:GTPase SAR1 family protein
MYRHLMENTLRWFEKYFNKCFKKSKNQPDQLIEPIDIDTTQPEPLNDGETVLSNKVLSNESAPDDSNLKNDKTDKSTPQQMGIKNKLCFGNCFGARQTDNKKHYTDKNNQIKIILHGLPKCGKSNLKNSFERLHDGIRNENDSDELLDEKIPVDPSELSVGINFTKIIYRSNDRIFDLQIWDTNGGDRYKNILLNYHTIMNYIIFVYDGSIGQGIDELLVRNLESEMMEFLNKSNRTCKIISICNKTYHEFEEIIDDREHHYIMDVSDQNNVIKLLQLMIDLIYEPTF